MKILNIKNCPIRNTLKIIGGKWALLIVFALKEEPKRFGEIKRIIPDISEKMLIQNLKILAQSGYIKRHDFKSIPPKVEYSLLKKGIKSLEIVNSLIAIGKS